MFRRAVRKSIAYVAVGLALAWLSLGCATRAIVPCAPDSIDFQRDMMIDTFGDSPALERDYQDAKREEARRCPG